ncbi:GtrA family protein [Mixta sp.]|uniref:GtrA family protein n=1 Tax=Mixta sp. TaxID=2100765 RepID=UPI00258C4474|nr:GtrA family protein [Mixta sp.]MCR1565640.1 GtrA family protein [Mixta sp.]
MIGMLTRYASVGVVNTAIHWVVYGLFCYGLMTTQAVANLAGFAFAVTFSFFANAYFTFKKKATGPRYIAYVIFMGFLSYSVGGLSDKLGLHPIATLIIFSPASVIVGFLFFNYFVFKDKAQ